MNRQSRHAAPMHASTGKEVPRVSQTLSGIPDEPRVQQQYFLRSAHIDAYGAFLQRSVGPFTSGMNVVYGANETGKTTVSSFIGGVLFGWEEARGNRNAYKPVSGERCGTLVFAPADFDGPEVRCMRSRNADGIQPDPSPAVLSNIDKETYDTVFSLDSDELLGLRRTSDITARLLTAGSGTATSPATALASVEERLSDLVSRKSGVRNSIPNLTAEQSRLRAELAALSSKAEQQRASKLEFDQLSSRIQSLQENIDDLNEQVEELLLAREAIAQANDQEVALHQRYQALEEEEAGILTQGSDALLSGLPVLDAISERELREQIENLAAERARLEQSVALARQDYLVAQTTLSSLEEADDIKAMQHKVQRQRTVQVVLSVLMPLLFAGAGVPMFVYGRHVASLSISALGITLVVFAALVAAGALVMLFRPNRAVEELENRVDEARWILLQDKNKLKANEAQLAECQQNIEDFLASQGLAEARGSIRRARALLDDAREVRAAATFDDQRRQALHAQKASLAHEFDLLEQQRAAAYETLGYTDPVSLSVIDGRLTRAYQMRDARQQTKDSLHARYGELKSQLGDALHDHKFDRLKLEEQYVLTRMGESLEEFAVLLIQKRLLRMSIDAWEGHSQPLVYRQAGRLLSIMTDGAWSQVRLGASGELEVANQMGMVRSVRFLSTGACQQLYLSIRLALLLTARNVGCSIPLIADDILVNFDGPRRHGAARVLAEVARSRQVIMFTCHREVVSLMHEVCPTANLIEL